jgi:hypothetical protein
MEFYPILVYQEVNDDLCAKVSKEELKDAIFPLSKRQNPKIIWLFNRLFQVFLYEWLEENVLANAEE